MVISDRLMGFTAFNPSALRGGLPPDSPEGPGGGLVAVHLDDEHHVFLRDAW